MERHLVHFRKQGLGHKHEKKHRKNCETALVSSLKIVKFCPNCDVYTTKGFFVWVLVGYLLVKGGYLFVLGGYRDG